MVYKFETDAETLNFEILTGGLKAWDQTETTQVLVSVLRPKSRSALIQPLAVHIRKYIATESVSDLWFLTRSALSDGQVYWKAIFTYVSRSLYY